MAREGIPQTELMVESQLECMTVEEGSSPEETQGPATRRKRRQKVNVDRITAHLRVPPTSCDRGRNRPPEVSGFQTHFPKAGAEAKRGFLILHPGAYHESTLYD